MKHTFRSKRELLRYLYDYYRWHALAVLVAALLVGILIRDLADRERYDYHVLLVTSSVCQEQTRDALARELGGCGQDLDGNGRVSVLAEQIYLTEREGQSYDADIHYLKLMTQMAQGDTALYILDEQALRQLQQTDSTYFTAWKEVSQCEALRGRDWGYAGGTLYLALRPEDGSAGWDGESYRRQVQLARTLGLQETDKDPV